MPVEFVHSTPHNANTHTRARSLSLSRGPLLPPWLPREKNPNPNPRNSNLYKCFEPKSSALGGYLSLLITAGSYSEPPQTRELQVPEKKSELENSWIQLFQNPKNHRVSWKNRQRTGIFLGDDLTLSKCFENHGYIQEPTYMVLWGPRLYIRTHQFDYLITMVMDQPC
jgi:hypothetical protein